MHTFYHINFIDAGVWKILNGQIHPLTSLKDSEDHSDIITQAIQNLLVSGHRDLCKYCVWLWHIRVCTPIFTLSSRFKLKITKSFKVKRSWSYQVLFDSMPRKKILSGLLNFTLFHPLPINGSMFD